MTTRSQLNDNSSAPSKQVSMESWVTFTLVSLVVVLLLVLAGAALFNESLASGPSLELWVWYFAFLRIEVFAGFFAGVLPVLLVGSSMGYFDEEQTDNAK